MKFAIVNNERYEAISKVKGACLVCGGPVIAKCGERNVHHWAHEKKQSCHNDRWETEGEWHQNWKSKFPKDWQERIVIVNEKKNIADVQNEQGLVVEFQHSHIKPEEQRDREHCYRNMVWVVDGMRLKNDFPRFEKNVNNNSSQYAVNYPLYNVSFIDEVFPKNWINNSVPVLFDFYNNTNDETPLYCLLPKSESSDDFSSFVLVVSKSEFISLIKTNNWQNFYPELLNAIATLKKAHDDYNEKQSSIAANGIFRSMTNRSYRKKYRRL